MTHLAKISHSTKWPSTNILNSLKTHVIEKSKNIIYTYIHNRHTYILKNAVLSKIKRSNGIIASKIASRFFAYRMCFVFLKYP